MVGLKGARDYTTQKRDLQESNLTHLQQAAEVYDLLAKEPNWVTVDCFHGSSKALRSPESIHREVLAAVESRLWSRTVAR